MAINNNPLELRNIHKTINLYNPKTKLECRYIYNIVICSRNVNFNFQFWFLRVKLN